MSSESGRPRLQISIQQPWFAIISVTERALVSLALGGLVFLSGGALDWFVTRQYLPRISLVLAGAAIALTVGLLVFQILSDIQGRYQTMLNQLRRIAELNHHIRNALQVIAYYNVPARDERAIHQVNAEVLRIEAVLREVSDALGTHAECSAATVPLERRHG